MKLDNEAETLANTVLEVSGYICVAWSGNSTAAQKISQSTQHNGRMSGFK